MAPPPVFFSRVGSTLPHGCCLVVADVHSFDDVIIYRHYLPLGAIEISALKPGTHIVRHCGPTNHRLRLHLGIKVPPLAAIKVGDVPARSWEEGKVMVMDDSFEHEVWNNNTKETRYAHTCAHVRTDA